MRQLFQPARFKTIEEAVSAADRGLLLAGQFITVAEYGDERIRYVGIRRGGGALFLYRGAHVSPARFAEVRKAMCLTRAEEISSWIADCFDAACAEIRAA